MKQELANDRGLDLAEVDDIPLWVAVSLDRSSLSFLLPELADTWEILSNRVTRSDLHSLHSVTQGSFVLLKISETI